MTGISTFRRLAGVFILGAFSSGLPTSLYADPLMINGIHPRTRQTAYAGRAYNTPENLPAGEAPLNYASTPPSPPQAPASDPYGGGFIELLLTGHTPQASVAPAPRSSPQMSALVPAAPSAAMADPSFARGIDPIYQRQEIDYSGPQEPGTIVIDTPHKFLYLVERGGKAIRYGIGVGRPGFMWSGIKTISRKAEWPSWTPPGDMLKRRPDLPRFMAGGPENPLGARALYLGSSLYRIHGTNEPLTIGTNVSSGCIRMMNQDVEDLYNRVHVGTKVVVM